MLTRVDFITDDLSLSLSLSATRGLRVDRGYNEIASLSLSLEILIQNSWKLIFR